MKKSFFIAGVLYAGISYGAPFLVSEPYKTTDAQPDSFVVTLDNGQPVTVPAIKDTSGQAYLKHDLRGLVGFHTIKVRAKNVWGESADSDPFTFAAGVPAKPANLGLTAQ